MKLSKVPAVFLTVAMIASSFSACGGQAAQSGEAKNTEKTDAPYTVTIYANGDATTEDCDAVAAEISKITEKLINVDVELVRGITKEQLNLALTSGEKLDLFYSFPWETSLASMANSNQIVAMDDLLKDSGKETLDAISADDWKCATVDGKIYGVPMNKDKAQAKGFEMDKAIADEVGIDYSSGKKTFDELEADLMKVHEAKPDIYPVIPNAGTIMLPIPYDTLGDDLGVLKSCLEDDTTVVSLNSVDAYTGYLNMIYDWSQKGLMMPDASNTTDGYDSFISSGVGFGTFTPIKAGFNAEESRKIGKDIVSVEIYPAFSMTHMVNAVWCIANNSEQPDKAMEVLNLMYTNPEISNLFVNGIEGKHYKVIDADNNVIDYADGLDASKTGYSVVGWCWPNEQITKVWKGDDLNVWKNLDEFNKSAVASPAKGFVWDNANVLNEVTACQNVVSKYKNGLECGDLDPAIALPKYNEELEAAGLNTIISEKQEQLDKWLAQ